MILLANAGVPMLAVVWPVAWLALLPVVLIESLIAIKGLGLQFRRTLVVTASANAVSTLVGIPITWFGLVVVEIITGGGAWRDINDPMQAAIAVLTQVAWLCPYEYDLRWMIPVAAMLLCVPFYFASVAIEYRVVRRMVANPPNEVRRFCWRANLWSYMLLVVFWGACLIVSA